MIVLDSDHLSVLEYPEADQAIRLQDRLRQPVFVLKQLVEFQPQFDGP